GTSKEGPILRDLRSRRKLIRRLEKYFQRLALRNPRQLLGDDQDAALLPKCPDCARRGTRFLCSPQGDVVRCTACVDAREADSVRYAEFCGVPLPEQV